MRLWPDSLAGRTTLVLVAGLVVSLIASLATTLFLDRVLGIEFRYPQLIAQVAQVVGTLNRVPAELRPRLLEELAEGRIEVAWSPHMRPPDRTAPGNWRVRHIEADLRRALRGFPPSALSVDQDRRGTRVWVRLDDGSWLRLAFSRDWFGPLWFLRFVLALAVLTAGIALLAIWAARRATVPLSRFAAAAASLGTNVDAPPLDETGPREIRSAAHAFNRMQERIRRLVDDRTQMLAAISHDLRTALTRLRLRVEFIEDAEQQAKAIADLEAMRTMLDETLAFARDEGAAEARTEVDLAALVQALCDDLADAGQPVSYAGPDRFAFAGRPVALRRAIANLVDNALKYGGTAEVTLTPSPDRVELTIADRGPGIPTELRERVFAPFFRLEASRSRETGGTGLGLAVARTIVHRHGGEIRLEDRPGGGLLVWITLPRAGR